MAKIVLGKRPETIAHTVKAPLPDGSTGEVLVHFKYRTRTEFAQLVDSTFSAAQPDPAPDAVQQENPPDAPPALLTVEDGTRRGIGANADYLQQIATGWNLDAPFDRQHLEQLCDELPGVALAIMNSYREAITEGRLGN